MERTGAGLTFYTTAAPKKFAKGETIAGQGEGTIIDLAGFSDGGSARAGNEDWLKATPGSISGYIGFKATVSSEDIYGWIKVSVRTIAWPESTTHATRPDRLTIYSYGYQPSGADIVAGAIPEPSTTATALGLLALGAVGIARKRKQKKSPNQ